jgi:hypothetical protein
MPKKEKLSHAFDSVYKAAFNQGAADLGRPTEKLIEGVGTLKFVYFGDPEGSIVELKSRKP